MTARKRWACPAFSFKRIKKKFYSSVMRSDFFVLGHRTGGIRHFSAVAEAECKEYTEGIAEYERSDRRYERR